MRPVHDLPSRGHTGTRQAARRGWSDADHVRWLSHIAGPPGLGGVTGENRKEIIMDARLDYYGNTVAAKFAKYINSAGAVVTSSALPAATQELVKIRAGDYQPGQWG
jgi:hypothetical protein